MLNIASPLSLLFHRVNSGTFYSFLRHRIHHSILPVLLIDLIWKVAPSTTLRMTTNIQEQLQSPTKTPTSMTPAFPTAPTPLSSPATSLIRERSSLEDDEQMLNTEKWPATTPPTTKTPPSTPKVNSDILSGRGVTFSKIEIIELPYTLGDNPCSSGPPITPSWVAQKRTILDLEFFERYRPDRRSKKALLLSRQARKSILIGSGHSPKEIMMATSDASKVRKERCDTIHQLRIKYQGMVLKANENGIVWASSPELKARLSSSPKFQRRPQVAAAGGHSVVVFPNHHQGMVLSPPTSDGLLIGGRKNWTPIRKKKHPGLHSPRDHSRASSLHLVPPKRQPHSPTNTILPNGPQRTA